MAIDALVPNDPRVEHKFTTIGDLTYHYMLAKPEGTPVATVVLCHGWPDLGMGWRNQVPYLLSLNLQVIVPDMLGYGQTSAPESYEEYTMKKISSHIATIIKEVTDQPIILGGHDWGGWFVWRLSFYHPELIRAVFSFCVPYVRPSPVKPSLEQIVAAMPNFRYQLQIASGVTASIVDKSPEHLRGFLNSLYGGTTPEGKPGFSTDVGIIEDIDRIRPSPLVSKDMMDFYVQEYSRHGLHGPSNWYRTRELESDDERAFAKEHPDFKFKLPAMLVMADRDSALPLKMAEGQERYFDGGNFKMEVVTGANHWVMLQKPEECNKFIGEFIKKVLGDDLKASL